MAPAGTGFYGNQVVHVDSANALVEAIKTLGKKDEFDWWNLAIQALVVVAAIWAGVTALKSLKATNRSIGRDKRYRDLAFIAEVDKLLIEYPELWAYEDAKKEKYESKIEVTGPAKIKITGTEKIFVGQACVFTVTASAEKDVLVLGPGINQTIPKGDNGGISLAAAGEITIQNEAVLEFAEKNTIPVILQSAADKLSEGRLDAFCYYKLNNFELALKDQDDQAKDCWEEYLAFIYRNSKRFERIIDEVRGTNRKIYNAGFVKQIEEIIEKKITVQGQPQTAAKKNP